MKIEGLYREKRELLATEVCWLLIAACVCVRERERERTKIMLYRLQCHKPTLSRHVVLRYYTVA